VAILNASEIILYRVVLVAITCSCFTEKHFVITGSPTRDLLPQFVFHESVSPGPLIIYHVVVTRRLIIVGDYENPEQGLTTGVNDNFVFIAGVNDTGDKLFTGVNNTGGGILSLVSLTPAINTNCQHLREFR
jgi:hypothetical protein